MIKEHEGLEVLYGSEVCLMHHDSGALVKANNDCAQTSRIGYDCQLSNWYSQSMIFKVLPRYKSRQDGEIIQYNDNLIFQNIKYNTYLSFTSDILLPHDREYERLQSNPFRFEQQVIDPAVDRLKVYLSQEAETPWRVLLFRKFGAHPLTIQGNQLIKLKHTEINGYLASGLRFETETPEVFIRNYLGEFKTEEDSVSSLWEIEHIDLEERGKDFKMEDTTQENDINYAKISNPFRLRHFLSGKLLHKYRDTNTNRDQLVLSATVSDGPAKHISNYSTLNAMPILKNITQIHCNSSYYLLLEPMPTDMHQSKYVKCDTLKTLKRDMILKRTLKTDFEGSQFFSPLTEKDLSVTEKVVFADPEFMTEDAFILEKLDLERQREILLVRSALPFLKSVAHMMQIGSERNQLKSEVFFKMDEILYAICSFLFNTTYGSESILKDIEGDPMPRRQQILKEMKVIDVFIDLLYLPFKSKMYVLSSIQSTEPIAGLLSNIYSTLRFTIQEYRPNELHASQWLTLIMSQSLETREYNDIQAGRTLTELIDNNQRILESRIEKDTISKFIKNLVEEERDCKSVNILRAICICDGKPMIKNQKEIGDQLLKNKRNFDALVFPLRRLGGKIEVQSPDINNKWIEVESFKKSSESTESGKSFKYFISTVNLCADLCMDRNYLAISVLQSRYLREDCFEILMDQQIPLEMRSAFCRLIEHLWVKIYPFEDIRLPEFTKTLINSSDEEGVPICTSLDISQFEQLKKFFLSYLEVCFEPKGVTTEFFRSQNELSLNVLGLCE